MFWENDLAGIRLGLACYPLDLPRLSPVNQNPIACLLRFSLIPQPTETGRRPGTAFLHIWLPRRGWARGGVGGA